ncbi:pentatricopeptide repeat domain containing protein, putative [Babesia bigemina]|uniref:Pentatricopeptide repeat domain containing protein, putative n=1 Tax=Babesia bigemina TaxID=5866 RepID=A0A061D7N9_BABBI|nr:pentatricopeptide repeat domain containing protein, putative [Babesia bigemina]CDR96007.1 pentatricopeptide repeat domain containing protein, putative [Babesia bigemina]|eukprot:XP_012768193.1 pentatricopeptide repeat domain containing protein, putative [Babesia bigemina]
MAREVFDSRGFSSARSGRSLFGEEKPRPFGRPARSEATEDLSTADDLIFTRLKTIFRGPVSCVDRDLNFENAFSRSLSDPEDPLVRGLYAGDMSGTCNTSLTSFDMSSCGVMAGVDSVSKLGFGESVMCLDSLAQALAADSASYADKEKAATQTETPLTHLASIETVATQDVLTPLGAGSVELGCDFADRVGKLLGRCMDGDEMAQKELATLCANEFNLPDAVLSPASVSALLRFCMLKGQLYFAGQLLQVAWHSRLYLAPSDQSQVLLSLCSSEAVGLLRSLLAKLPLDVPESEEVMSLFVKGVIKASRDSTSEALSNFASVLVDCGPDALGERAIRLVELFFREVDDASYSMDIVGTVQRICALDVFNEVSTACRFQACRLLCCGQPSEKADGCIKSILEGEGANVSFMEYVVKHETASYVTVVSRLIAMNAIGALDFLCALSLGHHLSQSGATVLKICLAAQQNLRSIVPEELCMPEFGDFEFLSCVGVNSFIQQIGPNIPSTMLGVCTAVSGIGKEVFTPLVETCLLVTDHAAAESVIRYMNEYYGHIPSTLVVSCLKIHLLRGNFRYVLERLVKKDRLGSIFRDRMNRTVCAGVAEFGLRVAISVLNFDIGFEFLRHCDTMDRISEELSELLQLLPPHLHSRSKVDEFVTLCERLNLDENAFSVALDCCLRLKNSKRLLRLINKFRRMGLQPQLQTCGVIIKSLACCGRIAECREIWQEMTANGSHEPNEVTYGIMLDAYVSNNRMDEAMALLHEMKHRGNVRPNTIMYTTLIKGFGQNRQLSRAMSIYDMMVSEGVARNTVTYNSIIDACARVGDMKSAAALLEEMMMNQIEPDLITFSTIIKGYCVQCNMDQSFQLLSIMYERGIKPDGILYNSLLEGCVKSGRLWLCEKLWEQMRLHGIAPSNFTLTILIKMYGRSGQLDKVFDLVGRLPVEYGFTINAHVYTCLMSACITNGRYSTALDIYRCVKDGSIKPDAKTYETLIQGVIRGNLYAEAADLLRDMYHLDGSMSEIGSDLAVLQKINTRVLENLFHKLQHVRLDEDVASTYRALSRRLQSMGVNVHFH